jgi:hypothetical protein
MRRNLLLGIFIIITCLPAFAIDSIQDADRKIELHQIDIRSRVSTQVKVPQIAELEIRVAREIRLRREVPKKLQHQKIKK